MSPTKYYHGTDKATAKKILREGLKVGRREDESPVDLGEKPQRFAFLGENHETAKAFAPGGKYRPKRNKDAVVLEIQPHPYIEKKLRKDIGEFVRSPSTIPPHYIKEYKE